MKIKDLHIIFLGVFGSLLLACAPVFAEQLIVPGTGANEVILKELAAAFNAENPGNEVIISPSVGSGGGIRNVGTGENILGRVARPIKEDEAQYGLEYLVFAKDMVLFVVGQKVGVQNLSGQQLADIFSGKVENWQEVGGSDERVRLLIREPEDSSLLIIRQKLEEFKGLIFSEKAKTLFHDYEMVNAINKYTTAIGWLTMSSMKEVLPDVTMIHVNNIAPTQNNAYDGKYILTGDHALVYKRKNMSGLAKKFVDFIFSKEGSKILINGGLVPVNSQQY